MINLQTSVEYAVKQATKSKELMIEYCERLKDVDKSLLIDTEKELLNAIKNTKAFDVPMIDVDEAFKFSGLNGELPRLAIATYENSLKRNNTNVMMWRSGDMSFSSKDNIGSDSYADYTAVTRGICPQRSRVLEASTITPLVPPELRQRNTKDVFILFEVAQWEIKPFPVDPYLLRRISGSKFSILGSWDLTQHEIDTYQACRL
ncbi:MAG: hypothetical protein WC554_09245 [Clostridia bacterium]